MYISDVSCRFRNFRADFDIASRIFDIFSHIPAFSCIFVLGCPVFSYRFRHFVFFLHPSHSQHASDTKIGEKEILKKVFDYFPSPSDCIQYFEYFQGEWKKKKKMENNKALRSIIIKVNLRKIFFPFCCVVALMLSHQMFYYLMHPK